MDYKEILKGIVDIINTTEKSDIGFANICTYIGENCPELKESEDERIRKALIRFHKSTIDIDGIKGADIILWLEKQKGNIGGISPNSALSEEDDMILSVIVDDLKFIRDTLSHDDSYVVDVGSFEGKIEWLQSLKDRVQPSPKK